MDKDSEQDKQIAILNTKIGQMNKSVDDIKNNHLISIYQQLNSIRKTMTSILTTIVVALIGVVATLMVALF